MNIEFPEDIKLAWERDFSFFDTHLTTVHHVEDLPRRLGKGYGMCAFVRRSKKVSFFRSDSSEQEFDKFVGERLVNEEGFAFEVARRLIELTDRIRSFLDSHKKISSASHMDELYKTMGEQFVYHMADYWGADYVASHYQRRQHKKMLDDLYRAREYNEVIYPSFERWITQQDEPLAMLTMKEARQFVATRELPSADEIKAREKCAFVYMDEAGKRYLSSGQKGEVDAKRLEHIADAQVDKDHGLIKGTSASEGNYTGSVRVISEFEKLEEVQPGDVLVVSATRPAYNQYIMKAGAIVTDERSVMSHAAIVAREFNIPCVVGTIIATKTLKDGDVVRVDADKGTVEML